MSHHAASASRAAFLQRAAFAVAAGVVAFAPAFGTRAARAAGASRSGAIRLLPVGDGPEQICVQEATRTVRWRTQRLPAATVAFELSTDHGATWSETGRAPSGVGELTWNVAAPVGLAQARLSVLDSDVRSRPRPVRIAPALRDVQSSGYLGFALMGDGTMRVWGIPREGMPLTAYRAIYRPQVLPGFAGIKSFTVANAASLFAVRNDGALLLWGDFDGPLKPLPIYSTPTVVDGVSGASFVRTGYGDVLVRLDDGRVVGWGDNRHGLLGDATQTPHDSPVEIPILRGATDIQFGYQYVIAVAADGSVLTWGKNQFGTLGDGTQTDRIAPQPVPGISDAVAVVAGWDASMALTREGRVFTWGRDNYLALGRDAPGVEGVYDAVSPSPGEVLGVGHVVAIAGWTDGGRALRDDGVLFGWGQNEFGWISDGTRTPRPRPVPCLLDHVDRFFGSVPVFAVKTDGSIWVWGSDQSEMLANGQRRSSSAKPQRIFMK